MVSILTKWMKGRTSIRICLFNASPTFESTATGSLTIRRGNDSDSQDSNINNFNRPTFYEQQPKTSKDKDRQCDPRPTKRKWLFITIRDHIGMAVYKKNNPNATVSWPTRQQIFDLI
jgi:hypothetical protein